MDIGIAHKVHGACVHTPTEPMVAAGAKFRLLTGTVGDGTKAQTALCTHTFIDDWRKAKP